MTLFFILLALGLLGAGALVALLFRSDREALDLGSAGTVATCLLGAVASADALLRGARENLSALWSVPIGSLRVGLDPLSSFFLLCVFLVSGLSALYGAAYFRPQIGRRPLGPVVALFNLLVASLIGVVIARDGVLFLVAWEVMTLSSFFLVTFDHDREEVRRAGLTYLIASHAGTAVLFVLFLLLARSTESFRMAGWTPPAGLRNLCFLLALAGFGTKAGFWPMHLWLPDAHPAAPSPVSALMSGVLIKMGIYGLLRTLPLLGPPSPAWGLLLVGIGAVSGVAGVLHALGQHDLKRLLAYHSVENIGIIALGLGVGLLGQASGRPVVAGLGYGGALLHVLNHGLFKGLLFQGAGSVLESTGTRSMDRLGGLQRRLPVTAATFLVGAAAISGLPPLNGFVSEWLIFLGAFHGAASLPALAVPASLLAVAALALIGGLAAACFVKAYGVVFLGTPRSEAAALAREGSPVFLAPMVAGAALCLLIGLWPLGAVRLVGPAVSEVAGAAGPPAAPPASLSALSAGAAAFLALALSLALLRSALLRRRTVTQGETWGCGYSMPTPRMQYTSASFAEPLLDPFALVVPRRVHRELPSGAFPREAAYESHLADLAGERLLVPSVRGLIDTLGRLRFLQQGRIQTYLAYLLVTLVALLAWDVAAFR